MAAYEMKSIRRATADSIKLLAAKHSLSAKTDSPIETILGAEIQVLMQETLGESFSVGSTGKESDFTLVPQYRVGRYRYDFALCVGGEAFVLIECDGKDYHSSPEQISNDASKDKLALDRGIQMMRFSGSMINSSPAICAIRSAKALLIEGKSRGFL